METKACMNCKYAEKEYDVDFALFKVFRCKFYDPLYPSSFEMCEKHELEIPFSEIEMDLNTNINASK